MMPGSCGLHLTFGDRLGWAHWAARASITDQGARVLRSRGLLQVAKAKFFLENFFQSCEWSRNCATMAAGPPFWPLPKSLCWAVYAAQDIHTCPYGSYGNGAFWCPMHLLLAFVFKFYPLAYSP